MPASSPRLPSRPPPPPPPPLTPVGPPVTKVFRLHTFTATYIDSGTSHYQYDDIAVGPFGYCSSRHGCSGASIGYDLARVLNKATGAAAGLLSFGTKTFIIIPITAGEPSSSSPPFPPLPASTF